VGKPKIIVLDLEILPNLDRALELWPQLGNWYGRTLKADVTSICCAGWKVLGARKIDCINAWDYKTDWKRNVNDDKKLCFAIKKVLEDADAIITHNGKKFDWKYLQTRFIINGLKPLPKIPNIDTIALARQNLFVFSNSLKHLAKTVLDDDKEKHEGWDLWVKTHKRDPQAMAKMTKYCKKDIALTEKLFLPLRPFANNIPNHNIFKSKADHCCPNCGSYKISRQGTRLMKTGKTYQRYKCSECASWFRTDAWDAKPRSI